MRTCLRQHALPPVCSDNGLEEDAVRLRPLLSALSSCRPVRLSSNASWPPPSSKQIRFVVAPSGPIEVSTVGIPNPCSTAFRARSMISTSRHAAAIRSAAMEQGTESSTGRDGRQIAQAPDHRATAWCTYPALTSPGTPGVLTKEWRICWWARQDSNLRQHRYERRVLTTELRARAQAGRQSRGMPRPRPRRPAPHGP
jgi:hypothetical protein